MRNSTLHLFQTGFCCEVYFNTLSPDWQKIFYPFVGVTSDTIYLELFKQYCVIYFIKDFWEVNKHTAYKDYFTKLQIFDQQCKPNCLEYRVLFTKRCLWKRLDIIRLSHWNKCKHRRFYKNGRMVGGWQWIWVGDMGRVKKHFLYFKKYSICMFPNKSFVFGPWRSWYQTYQSCGKDGKLMSQIPCRVKQETTVFQFLRGSACTQMIVFFKLMGGVWLAMARFLCCCRFFRKVQFVGIRMLKITKIRTRTNELFEELCKWCFGGNKNVVKIEWGDGNKLKWLLKNWIDPPPPASIIINGRVFCQAFTRYSEILFRFSCFLFFTIQRYKCRFWKLQYLAFVFAINKFILMIIIIMIFELLRYTLFCHYWLY